jgi:sulfotransferase
MRQFHFLAGLPRSGSTLLAAILRQNPMITASMSSPLGAIFSQMQRAVSRGNEAAMFLNDGQRERLLRHIFTECYEDANEIVFDTNRMWPSKLPTLVRLFPDCKIVCCVRPVQWVIDSVERLIRANAFELSGIFGFEPGGTVYSRANGLSSGMVGFAMDALREGFYGEHASHMLFVEYEALARYPSDTVKAVYEWLGLTPFEHDFDRIEQVPGAAEFDEKLGTPGLHRVGSKVEWKPRPTVLPPEVFGSFPPPFWRVANNGRVPVIHCDPLQEAA